MLHAKMRFDIITIFPHAFDSYFNTSILKRAQKSGGAGSGFAGKPPISIRMHNLRDYTTDKHHKVDDRPYGGGAGMVMKVEPLFKAVSALKKFKTLNPKSETNSKSKTRKSKIILLSASGKQFDQRMAERWAKLDQLVLIAGHYEGVDARVMKFVDDAVSVGPYVLTGGELPSMTIVDAVVRLIPGVLGNPKSLDEESFNITKTHLSPTPYPLLPKEYPHYTRPDVFSPKKGVHWKVPSVLLTGDHEKIKKWREKHMK